MTKLGLLLGYKPMKLTAKGKRFGDVVRSQLADPDSRLSAITRKFNAYKKLAKTNPEAYQISLYAGFIHVTEKNRWSEVINICPEADMSYFWRRRIGRLKA